MDVDIDDLFRIGGGGRLTSSAQSTGDAGAITIDAGIIEVNGQRSHVRSDGDQLGDALGGAGGDIALIADAITLNDSTIASISEKRSGNITLTLRDGQGTLSLLADDARIASDTHDSGGQAGNIVIFGGSGTLLMNEVASITSNPKGDAAGGDIDIEIGRLEMSGRSFISATTFGSGNAGAVRLDAQDVLITGSGRAPSSAGHFLQLAILRRCQRGLYRRRKAISECCAAPASPPTQPVWKAIPTSWGKPGFWL